ncbi:hypothetical protein [Streptomyces sp. NBC_01497]|uniref:hypothetical protein n=1 Tax=Streptomyces sp. NBC_01497 TaxID=2903885 RepID=UPI002E326BD0|nr:hypothetical protein [Streptomyces sp. NBC_01497]
MEKEHAARRRRIRPLRAVPVGDATRDAPGVPGGRAEATPVRDDRWFSDARTAVVCGTLLSALLLVVDAATGGLSTAHAVAWCGLGLLLFVVLVPRRVRAGAGWVSSRGLLREQRVRTDRLVSVLLAGGVAQRLVLRDTDGGRIELDPRRLLAAPQVWHRVEVDALGSLERGTLCQGGETLRRVGRHLDEETARTVFRTSGLR